MISEATNHRLTRIEGQAPMGDLLRRYWHPIAGASELDTAPIKPLRLFGEELVLYRDRSGEHGLIDRRCPRRSADLANGYVDAEGLRCGYHGWNLNADGAVSAMPYDDVVMPGSRLKELCTIPAYPVRELADLLWAYFGPLPAPELPVWEMFTRTQGFCESVISAVPCNWLQCQENAIDPVHFEWLHENWPAAMESQAAEGRRHVRVAFDAKLDVSRRRDAAGQHRLHRAADLVDAGRFGDEDRIARNVARYV